MKLPILAGLVLAIAAPAMAQSLTMRPATAEESLELFQADWFYVSQRRGDANWPDQVIMADAGTQERDGDNGYIWIRFVGAEHLDNIIAALDVRMQYVCSDGRNRPVSQRLIGDGDFQLDRRYEDPDGYFDPAPPQGQVGHELMLLACSDSATWTEDYAKQPVGEDPLEQAHAFLRGDG